MSLLFKFSVCFTALVGFGYGDLPWDESRGAYYRPVALRNYDPDKLFFYSNNDLCDIPTCSTSCEGAPRPRKCPVNNNLNCNATGCACITFCDDINNVICYETKSCERKVVIPKRRRRTTKSMKKKKNKRGKREATTESMKKKKDNRGKREATTESTKKNKDKRGMRAATSASLKREATIESLKREAPTESLKKQ